MPHRKIIHATALVLTLAGVSLCAPAASRADDMPMPAGVKGEMMMWFEDAESKLVQLSDATSEAKYNWRPGKGVRSTGEVFMHVAAANFGIPTMAGVPPPAGFSMETYEKSLTKKADIQKALKDSFEHMEKAWVGFSDADLEKEVRLPFGAPTTVRGAYLLLLSHAHEHLGQSIAYARMNGVVPPWTAKQNQAMKEGMEKNKAAKQ